MWEFPALVQTPDSRALISRTSKNRTPIYGTSQSSARLLSTGKHKSVSDFDMVSYHLQTIAAAVNMAKLVAPCQGWT